MIFFGYLDMNIGFLILASDRIFYIFRLNISFKILDRRRITVFLLLWISNKFYSKCFHSSVFEVVRFQVPFSALEKSIGIHNGRSGRHSPCTINLRYEYMICKIITQNLLVNMPFTFFVQKYQIWSCLLVQDLQPVPQFLNWKF